jgi:hypothetical protein
MPTYIFSLLLSILCARNGHVRCLFTLIVIRISDGNMYSLATTESTLRCTFIVDHVSYMYCPLDTSLSIESSIEIFLGNQEIGNPTWAGGDLACKITTQ